MNADPVTEKLRLLPVYTLEGGLFPKKPQGIRNGLQRAAFPAERTAITHRKRMTLLNAGTLRIADGGRGIEAGGASGETDRASDSMLPMMPDIPVLNYREPASAPTTQPAVTQTEAQPGRAELIRKFGNLIDGADAGLTPSFGADARGMGEAMAAIEQTAERVAANTKLIEEIREKQRTIEEITLKSTDIETISDEMIRRLRSRMRFDRSRFTE